MSERVRERRDRETDRKKSARLSGRGGGGGGGMPRQAGKTVAG